MENKSLAINLFLKPIKQVKDMKNFLLTFFLTLLSFQNAYGQTCVINNYSEKKKGVQDVYYQDVYYIIHWEACGGKQYTSDPISDGLAEHPQVSIPVCSDQSLYAKAKCPDDQVEIEIIGKTYPLASNCKIVGTPEEIATYTFWVNGTGCKPLETSNTKMKEKKIQRTNK